MAGHRYVIYKYVLNTQNPGELQTLTLHHCRPIQVLSTLCQSFNLVVYILIDPSVDETHDIHFRNLFTGQPFARKDVRIFDPSVVEMEIPGYPLKEWIFLGTVAVPEAAPSPFSLIHHVFYEDWC